MARAGAISPIDVTVPAQTTALGPEKTSFFQALSIPTKITRGMIEITSNVPLLHVGDKVGSSEATLLQDRIRNTLLRHKKYRISHII